MDITPGGSCGPTTEGVYERIHQANLRWKFTVFGGTSGDALVPTKQV